MFEMGRLAQPFEFDVGVKGSKQVVGLGDDGLGGGLFKRGVLLE